MIQLELPLEAPPAPPLTSGSAELRPRAVAPGRAERRGRPPSERSLAAMLRLARYCGVRLGARRRVRELGVVWNRRLRTALGRADFAARTIELNPILLDRHPRELVPTLVHELCHLVVGPRAAHGPRWREAMRALGQRAEACHRLDVSDLRARRRVWIWTCIRCGETYPRRSRVARRYRCGRCHGKLAVGATAKE
jgi:predicted SprT family Zn-dependent metalloprotease